MECRWTFDAGYKLCLTGPKNSITIKGQRRKNDPLPPITAAVLHQKQGQRPHQHHQTDIMLTILWTTDRADGYHF